MSSEGIDARTLTNVRDNYCVNHLQSIIDGLESSAKKLRTIKMEMEKNGQCQRLKITNVLEDIKKEFTCDCSSDEVKEYSNGNESCNDKILNGDVVLKSIGSIITPFSKKWGTPRQTAVCSSGRGKIDLDNSVFTNPQHALEGLQDFSHMWVLFHFHKNHTTHIRAKVAPPRLNGIRTGIFSTRSPNRPSSIGLSLVHIEKVEGNSVYFSGVDMLDGTPVLDIKPYIPQYDDPGYLLYSPPPSTNLVNEESSDSVDLSLISREAPEGEDEVEELTAPRSTQTDASHMVRVPKWISNPATEPLQVFFNDKCKENLQRFKENQNEPHGEDLELTIENALKEDPRSVYVREKYNNQFYTFLISNLYVSCKFDDFSNSVTVYRISDAEHLQ